MNWLEITSIVLCTISLITFGLSAYDYYKYGDFIDSGTAFLWGIRFHIYLFFLCSNLVAFVFQFQIDFEQLSDFNPMSVTSISLYLALLPLILWKTYETVDNILFHFHLKRINKKRGQ